MFNLCETSTCANTRALQLLLCQGPWQEYAQDVDRHATGLTKGAKENLQAILRLMPHACQQAAGGDSGNSIPEASKSSKRTPESVVTNGKSITTMIMFIAMIIRIIMEAMSCRKLTHDPKTGRYQMILEQAQPADIARRRTQCYPSRTLSALS